MEEITVELKKNEKKNKYHLRIRDGWLYLDTALLEELYEKDPSININTEFYKEGYSRNIFQDIKQLYITIPVEQMG